MADVLARYVICRHLQWRNEDIRFRKNQYGKPYFESDPSYCFNVSHSGDWVVCGISNTAIGIDVEEIKPIRLDIANLSLHKEEYRSLCNREEHKKLPYFYELWTLKESYLKAVGVGLFEAPDTFQVLFHNDRNRSVRSERGRFHLKVYPLESHYILSLCSAVDGFPEGMERVKLSDIEKQLKESTLAEGIHCYRH